MAARSQKPFTGKHAAIILCVFFGIIMAVNFTMARYASATFGGVVVKNSYVASQEFNKWLDRAEEQAGWGWQVTSQSQDDGRVLIRTHGVPADAAVTAVARHPLGKHSDTTLAFRHIEGGTYVSTTPLPDDRWTLRMQVSAGGKVWRGEDRLP